MQDQIQEIAQRIRTLREILELSIEELAQANGVTTEEYMDYEAGNRDFTFTFLYNCAKMFGVDIVELLTGDSPKLQVYSVVRKDTGLNIRRRKGFDYRHLAYRFSKKIAEPFLVTAPYIEEEQDQLIHLSRHNGQEFDYIIKGTLKFQIDGHVEYLEAGDAIYYDSSHGHGMIAVGGEECTFMAIVMNDQQDDKED